MPDVRFAPGGARLLARTGRRGAGERLAGNANGTRHRVASTQHKESHSKNIQARACCGHAHNVWRFCLVRQGLRGSDVPIRLRRSEAYRQLEQVISGSITPRAASWQNSDLPGAEELSSARGYTSREPGLPISRASDDDCERLQLRFRTTLSSTDKCSMLSSGCSISLLRFRSRWSCMRRAIRACSSPRGPRWPA